MAEVKVENVSKIYAGTVEAVKNLSLTCPDGGFLALLGPSGCGKTSTMRMIAGLESVTTGSILIDGRIVNDLAPPQRNVAMAFERYGLYPHLSVFENIAYPLRVRHFAGSEILERTAAVIGLLRLADVVDTFPTNLSLGQKQRVSLARALVRQPTVFLLDEPLSHLEPELRIVMRSELKRLHQELQHTTIFVTHDQSEALALADSIAVMNLGVLQQIGTPDEIYFKPANIFVASFVGDPPMNLIPFRLQREGPENNLVHDSGFSHCVPERFLKATSPDRMPEKVVLGVRPSALSIGTEKPSSESLVATIQVVEPLGDITLVTARLNDTIVRLETRRKDLAEDQIVYLTFDAENVVLFDPFSTKALPAAQVEASTSQNVRRATSITKL